MGRRIDEMSPKELAAALKSAARLVQATAPGTLTRPDIEVAVSPKRTRVGRAFKWAFLPAGQLWSERDRAATQARLDAFAAECGLADAVVHFGTDRLDVEVPRPLQAEQVVALQQWLDSEREALDVSQVP
jgi:hypothetical protein